MTVILVVLLALAGICWGVATLLHGDVVGWLIAAHMKATGRDQDGED